MFAIAALGGARLDITHVISTGGQSLRSILRAPRRSPATAAVVVLSLAIAIAGSAVIYSAIDTVLRLVPARDQERLVFVASTNSQRGQDRLGVSIPDFVDWSEQGTSFEALTAFTFGTLSLTGVDAPIRVSTVRTSANLPSVWGFVPIVGRTFRSGEDEPGAARVVLLTSSFWQRQFSEDRAVLGRLLMLNGEPHSVIGVTSPDVNVGIFGQADVIVPLVLDAARTPRDERSLFVAGLLQSDVTRTQSAAELADIARRLEAEYSSTNAGIGVTVRPLIELTGRSTSFVIVLLGLVAVFLLLIACANVANVLLAYWTGRRREFAIRAALGASRAQQVSHLMIESFFLSSLAGATGLLLAVWGVALIRSAAGAQILVFNEMAINQRALGFGVLISFIAPFVFALLPAFRSSAPNAQELRDRQSLAGGVRGARLRQILVVGQVALAFLLVIEMASLVRTAWSLSNIEKGFDPSNVLTLRVDLPAEKYAEDRQIREFVEGLLSRIERLPGVMSTAATNRLPIADPEQNVPFTIEGQPIVAPEALPRAARAVITQAYLRTLQIPLFQGRTFTSTDTADAPAVAIINREMARRHWPAGDAIGRRIQFASASPRPYVEIVGVAGDVRSSDADAGPFPQIYLPAAQAPERSVGIVLRTEGPRPTDLTSAIRTQVAQLDKELPVFDVATMEQVLFADLGSTYMLVGILAAVALVALTLAAGGIYGLIAYSVSQRTREIGIRMALGAEQRVVMTMMLKHAALALGVGGLIGVSGGFALVYLTSSELGEVDPRDPVVYGMVLLFLAGVTFLASYLPARRVLRVDPIVALRAE
jgi:putative ABC transport system permease protein